MMKSLVLFKKYRLHSNVQSMKDRKSNSHFLVKSVCTIGATDSSNNIKERRGFAALCGLLT